MCSKGQRDADSSISKTEATMDFSFLTLQFLLLQCIQGVPYIALQRGNGGSNPSGIKEFKGQESSYLDSYEENSTTIFHFAHIPMYMGLRSKAAYTREYCFKSCA